MICRYPIKNDINHRKDAKNAKNEIYEFRMTDVPKSRSIINMSYGLVNKKKLCVLCVFAVNAF